MKTHIASALALTVALAAAAPAAAQADFSAHWHDGRAELDGYALTISRYGETRTGRAVMIYVTEPFSESMRVKLNDANANPDDTVDVLKLNLVRDFQTGIYDYNTMVSTFARTSDFQPLKVSFSSAEWCGHVYSELLFDDAAVRGKYDSYFEGESGTFELTRPRGGVSEDNLFILLRGLRDDFLTPGAAKTVDYLPGVLYSRLSHHPLEWTRATITREKSTRKVVVPAGEFDAMVYTVQVDGGRAGTFFVEADYPHRIVKWSLAPDVSGELTGSTRLQYWRLNHEGDESYLHQLGFGDEAER